MNSFSSFDFERRICQIRLTHDIVPVEYFAGLVSADSHGDNFRNPAANHVTNRRAPKIVKQQSRATRSGCQFLPPLAKVQNRRTARVGENKIRELLATD